MDGNLFASIQFQLRAMNVKVKKFIQKSKFPNVAMTVLR